VKHTRRGEDLGLHSSPPKKIWNDAFIGRFEIIMRERIVFYFTVGAANQIKKSLLGIYQQIFIKFL